MKINKRILIISAVAIVIVTLGIKLYITETTRLSKMQANENELVVETSINIAHDNTAENKSSISSRYTIINQERLHNIKKSFDIRLSNKVTKPQLKEIAEELKDNLKENFERIFIVYYLPEMQVGNGGWATTHYNPDLEVKILGLTIEQENQINNKNNEVSNTNKIGQWIDESPYAGCIMTLYHEGNSIYLESKYGDGTSGKTEMKEIKRNGEIRYIDADDNDFGEYYHIDTKGNLGVFDNQGLIFTAIKK